MTDSVMFHEGNRRLQDQFDSRRISDRLEEFSRKEFTSEDREFIERAPYFFLATANAAGQPDCSFKGGMPGFVAVTGPIPGTVRSVLAAARTGDGGGTAGGSDGSASPELVGAAATAAVVDVRFGGQESLCSR